VVENLGRNYLEEPGIRGIVVHTRDITRHVQVEGELEETEQRYRSLVSAMAEGVVLQDSSGAIVMCNRSAEHILGLSNDELRGTSPLDSRWHAIHEDGSPFPGMDHPSMVTLRTGAPQSNVTMGIHQPDHTLTWLSINTQPIIKLGATAPHAVVCSFHDITERKHAEDALRQSAEEILDLYNNAPCGYHSLAQDGTFVRVNDTELKWLGYTQEELIGKKKLSDLLTPQGLQTFKDTFPPFVEQGWIRDVEYELIRKDGTLLPVLISATAIKDAQGRYVMSRSMMYDVTDRKRAENALKRVNRALRVLSHCNTALVHAQSQEWLVNEICRLLIESGGYRMAWVGFAEHDEARTVRPVAHYGYSEGYLEAARVSWNDDEFGQGPAGTAIRTGAMQINTSFATDPRLRPWREQALARGFASSIALPLRSEGVVFGVLAILSSAPDAFDTEEVILLQELADDLSFGIAGLRTRAQHKDAEERVRRLAYFDALTGLPNRVQLRDGVEQAIARAGSAQHPFGLMTVNVERFRDLQNGLGIRQADVLLQQISQRLQQAVTRDQLLARLGADEFAVLMPVHHATAVEALAQRMQEVMSAPFEHAGLALDVQVRIGTALYPEHGLDPDSLLLRSAIAARDARSSPTHYALYSGATDQESPHRLALVGELRRAIHSGQLALFYQPKIDIRTARVSGAEALLRWRHPERGMIPPDEFIGLAESTGLIKPLTAWVLLAAMQQSVAWRRQGLRIAIAVNVSPSNLREPDFLEQISGMQARTGVDPELIQIELTETTLMEDTARSHEVLQQLKQLGMGVFVDDFGTGHSSLSYIATLPMDALKIDRSFVMNMMRSRQHRTVVAASISLAHSLGIRVVSEGVETLEQARELERLECDELQGYLFSRPLPADDFTRWLAEFSMERYGMSRKR
jgi:diguanylate cyclase (GGDEF)-like protein/PAS domain S-box-containing protein